MINRLLSWLFAFCLFAQCFGCATTSILVPYPDQVRDELTMISQGREVDKVSGKGEGLNGLLHWLELGRVMQIQGKHEESVEAFNHAIDKFERYSQEAMVQVTDLGQQGAAVVVNDNAQTYKGKLYERGFLHTFQAMNYLMERDLEAAAVEVRRLDLVQKMALQRHEKKLVEAAEQDQKNKGVDMAKTNKQIEQRLWQMNEKVKSLKQGFVSGYAYYISGLIYELRGEINDAYIDYKKALELAPENPVIQRDVIRLGERLGFNAEMERLKESLPKRDFDLKDTSGKGEVIVLVEQGFVPRKHEVSLPIYKYNGELLMISLPAYNQFSSFGAATEILHSDHVLLSNVYPVTEVQAMAAKALSDDMPAILTRQIARAVAKSEMQNKARKEAETVGLILGNIYSLVTERADLRSWLALPNQTYIARFYLPEGDQQILLRNINTGELQPISLAIEDGHKEVVQCASFSGSIQCQQAHF